MASQVLSGSSNVSYTNNTGQNVRIVINFMSATSASTISMSWAGVSISVNGILSLGRNLAFAGGPVGTTSITYSNANNAYGGTGDRLANGALPTELMLAPGQTFSTVGINAYNIVVIPEAG